MQDGDALRAIQEETDKITTVPKECESRGIMHDVLEKAETGDRGIVYQSPMRCLHLGVSCKHGHCLCTELFFQRCFSSD